MRTKTKIFCGLSAMILTAAISANAKQGLATKVAENDSTATATNKPVKTEPAVP